MEQKLKKVKKFIDGKLSQEDRSLKEVCSALKENFTKEIKSEIKKQLEEQNDKITRLEADKVMLQEQIKILFTQNQRNQEDVEELEQYGRRLRLQIDGVPIEEEETSDGVLQKIIS